jgi:hypothetical protein
VVPLPSLDALKDLIGNMTGKKVLTKLAKPVTLGPRAPGVVAVYVLDDGKLTAAWACELALAGSIGAALSMFPLGRVEDALKAGQLDEGLTEAFYEIANVGANVFNAEGLPHVKLKQLYRFGPDLPPEVAGLVARPGARKDFEVNVAGFPVGRISVLVAK